MKDRITLSAFALSIAALAATCDKVPLLAPSGSVISLTANALTVPTNGTVGLTAFVTESSGTAVQNGTTVSFSTTLGTVTPVQTQTTNGLAVATFTAGSASGVATVRAISGGATGGAGSGSGSGGTTTTTAANTVIITIGAAAVKTITVSANPTSVSPNGGSVTLTASVVDTTGGSLTGIPVNFSADHGTVNPAVATTDVSGLATTTLTTAVETKVTASAGSATGTATVTLRASPGVTLQCAFGNASCTAVAASDVNNTATVTFTVAKATGSSALREATLDFGDGSRQSLGTLAASATVPHTYSGSSGSTATYAAVVTATDLENERTTASTIVNVTPRAPLTIDLTAVQDKPIAGTGETVTFTAKVTGGTAQSFAWDFDGDGTVDATTSGNTTTHIYTTNGPAHASVTATTTDGRTVTGRAEFIVSGI
jgi:Bacterial Ig-like domain (group 1)/PKD domain